MIGKKDGANRNESQTVLRAWEVLKAFHYLGEKLRLIEVMERTGLPKTTTFRLLRTLIHGGLIERARPGTLEWPRELRRGARSAAKISAAARTEAHACGLGQRCVRAGRSARLR